MSLKKLKNKSPNNLLIPPAVLFGQLKAEAIAG